MTNALCQITAIALTHYAIVLLRRISPSFARIVDGTPVVLLEKGKWHSEAMRNLLMQDDDVMAMARDQGLERLDQIDYAILERNGEISIIPASSE